MTKQAMMAVNGQPVSARGTVLDSCRDAGVDVPALCQRNGSGGGHCRSCVVELDGKMVAACTTPAVDGTSVTTDTPRLQNYRQDLGELMLSESRPAGPVADTLRDWGATGNRYATAIESSVQDHTHPYLRLDMSQCIKCRLCESACANIQGKFVFSFAERGAQTSLQWGTRLFDDSRCVACGACVDICPTGAIADVDRLGPIQDERTTRTTCSYCGVGCQLDVVTSTASDGRPVIRRIDGAPAQVNKGHLCVKGRYAHGFVRHPDRLTSPLIRKDGELVPCSWTEAVEAISSQFTRLRGRVAGLSSSRCTNEENYLFQKWFRAGLGTHNVDCCARVCHAPTATGMTTVFGTGAATNSLDDVESADAILVAGANCTESHPVVGARVVQTALNGTPLIVIDPRRTELAAVADIHLQLRPGTNIALLNSFACALVDESLVDERFIASRTEGYEDYMRFVRTYRPEDTAAETGVPATLVRQAARIYGRAQRPLQLHGLGMTEHYQGSEGVMLLCNLALLVGGVGRQGVGVNPLRGQNNVQGAADMGCQPNAMTGYADPNDDAIRQRFREVWDRPLPTEPGLTLPAMYAAARRGDIAALFILGEDVVQSDPSAHVDTALEALEFLVVQELFLSETAKRADVVLPGASYLEKDGTFTNGERRIQRVRKVCEPIGQARADWQILQELMTATGYPQSYRHPSQIMAEIGRVAPAFSGVSYGRLDAPGADGLQWPVPDAEHPGTQTLHVESFPVGKAEFALVDYKPSPGLDIDVDEFPLRLTTGRVLEHYNCGSMTRRTKNIELCPEDVLELHPQDAEAAGLTNGEVADIRSPHGTARARVQFSGRIARGSAFLSFHFPDTETNKLTSPVLDRLADCPEYKVIPIAVQPGVDQAGA